MSVRSRPNQSALFYSGETQRRREENEELYGKVTCPIFPRDSCMGKFCFTVDCCRTKRRRTVTWIIVVILLLVGIALGIYFSQRSQQPVPTSTPPEGNGTQIPNQGNVTNMTTPVPTPSPTMAPFVLPPIPNLNTQPPVPIDNALSRFLALLAILQQAVAVRNLDIELVNVTPNTINSAASNVGSGATTLSGINDEPMLSFANSPQLQALQFLAFRDPDPLLTQLPSVTASSSMSSNFNNGGVGSSGGSTVPNTPQGRQFLRLALTKFSLLVLYYGFNGDSSALATNTNWLDEPDLCQWTGILCSVDENGDSDYNFEDSSFGSIGSGGTGNLGGSNFNLGPVNGNSGGNNNFNNLNQGNNGNSNFGAGNNFNNLNQGNNGNSNFGSNSFSINQGSSSSGTTIGPAFTRNADGGVNLAKITADYDNVADPSAMRTDGSDIELERHRHHENGRERGLRSDGRWQARLAKEERRRSLQSGTSSYTPFVVNSIDVAARNLTGSINDIISVFSSLINLNLSRNNITGTVPPKLYAALPRLRELQLYSNQLNGTIASELAQLQNLEELYLDGNRMVGRIPSQVGEMSRLNRIDMFDNLLFGTVPPQIGQLDRLRTLWLSSNALGGTIPPDLCNCRDLENLYLDENFLIGTIPSCLTGLSGLDDLRVNSNLLGGSILSEFGDLSRLKILYLDNNSFDGTIPTDLGKLVNLEHLALANNRLNGTVPLEIGGGQLQKLKVLNLSNNVYSGTVPQSFSSFTNLETLKLSNANLSGALPDLSQSVSTLKDLTADGNSFSGAFPAWVANLGQMEIVNLENNNFVGILPDLSGLSQLREFNVANNGFTQAVPSWLGALSKIESVNLQNNQFTGSLPPSLELLPNVTNFDVSGTSNQVFGSLPPQWCLNASALTVNCDGSVQCQCCTGCNNGGRRKHHLRR